MKRYIDADKIEYFALSGYGLTNKQFAHKPQIDEIPTADVAPVVHARWYYHYRLKKFVCLNCGFEQSKKPNFRFCPHCGAKMDEEGDDE